MARRQAPLRDRDGGYLLIEALTTLALSALVLAGLIALAAVLVRAGDRAALRLETLETGRRAVAAMARETHRLSRLRFAGEDNRFVFLGRPDRLVFAVSPLQANGLRSPVVVAYQAASPGIVLRAETPLPRGAAGLDEVALADPRPMSAGVDDIRFAYVERSGDGGEVITDSWLEPAALPFAIRIDRVNPATGQLVASLRVPVLTQAEPGCGAPGGAFCSRARPRRDGGGDPAPPAQGGAPGAILD